MCEDCFNDTLKTLQSPQSLLLWWLGKMDETENLPFKQEMNITVIRGQYFEIAKKKKDHIRNLTLILLSALRAKILSSTEPCCSGV